MSSISASMGGAWKAYLESLGLGVPWYRDGAPLDAEGHLAVRYPFGVVQEGIGFDQLLHGDFGDTSAHLGTSELVQLDLYQLVRAFDPHRPGRTIVTEDYTLADRLAASLTGIGLQEHAPWRVYGHRPTSAQRFPIQDNVLRHSWTVRVDRDTRRLT